jgi:hypothetical protein
VYDIEFPITVGLWQFSFAGECVADVVARTLTTEAPSYATIMELDKKVREFPLPEGTSSSSNDFTIAFQKCLLEHVRECREYLSLHLVSRRNVQCILAVLLYIHRSFFAQAIMEQPTNPLKSPYAHSFLAAYRASSTILKSVQQQFEIRPIPSARFWAMWTFALSSAVRSSILRAACINRPRGCVWDCGNPRTKVTLGAECDVRARAGVRFVLPGCCL